MTTFTFSVGGGDGVRDGGFIILPSTPWAVPIAMAAIWASTVFELDPILREGVILFLFQGGCTEIVFRIGRVDICNL